MTLVCVRSIQLGIGRCLMWKQFSEINIFFHKVFLNMYIKIKRNQQPLISNKNKSLNKLAINRRNVFPISWEWSRQSFILNELHSTSIRLSRPSGFTWWFLTETSVRKQEEERTAFAALKRTFHSNEIPTQWNVSV